MLALGRDWFLVFGLIFVATRADAWWVTLPSVISIGLVQFAIGEALLHEASHSILVRGDRRWNEWWGALCALPFFTTLRDWRAEHLQHHRRFGTADDHIAQDYAVHRLTGPSPPIGWVWFGKPFLGLTFLRHVRGLGEINSTGGWMKVAAFWIPILTICWLQQLLVELTLYWLIPQFTVFATLLHWSEIGDHYRTRSGSRSRTGRLHNWLFHNNGYHAVHHRFPALPFTKLASAHRALGETQADVTRGWWGVWRQISRPREPVPEQWAAFWPKHQ
jgi:fatty acid desaturase